MASAYVMGSSAAGHGKNATACQAVAPWNFSQSIYNTGGGRGAREAREPGQVWKEAAVSDLLL